MRLNVLLSLQRWSLPRSAAFAAATTSVTATAAAAGFEKRTEKSYLFCPSGKNNCEWFISPVKATATARGPQQQEQILAVAATAVAAGVAKIPGKGQPFGHSCNAFSYFLYLS